ncbi:MAG: type I-E CRISPR-associated protein Cas7/Cse4/CasC [Chloroflexi bacterium]|nr:type I-E CRISPR-associated protein Cas7/Cse4/CasC [Chloroflexota bacterium]
MTTPRFLQIHTLHSYPAALLNRDDSGLAKRMPFGGATRTRISSQCLKRHWRVAEDEFAIHGIPGAERAVRSRNVVERMVMAPLREEGGVSDDVLDAVEAAFNVGVYGSSGTSESGRQPLLLGLPEVEHLRQRAAAICSEHSGDASAAKKEAEELFSQRRGEGNNFRALLNDARLPAGLEGALFGRMVTSDPGANIDAAVHVAHAFTVHREESESDYFSVVDDLQGDDEDAGAAHIGDMELTAGLFYGYVVVDVPGLVSNLEGCTADQWESADRTLAAKVVEHLTHLIATVSPGAKLGSTAPYTCADLMLIEAGSRQPRSLANAFRPPAMAQIEDAAKQLSKYLAKLDAAYGARESRRVMTVEDREIPGSERLPMDDLAAWVADAVRSGTAG